jgi:integrase/recombinase XerD
MLAVAGCHRDRLLLAAMHDCGLRVGEALGLWRGDMHLTEGVSADCPVEGAHLHVRRRRNCNGAVSKSRSPRWVPATGEVVRWYGLYLRERDAVGAARRQRLLFVNLSRRAGLPMRYRNAHEMVVRAAANAGVGRTVTPHTLRHCYGTALRPGGADRDVIATLMGHRSHPSADVYIHPTPGQLRVAVADMVAVRKLAQS